MFYILIATLVAGLATNYFLLQKSNYPKAYLAWIPLTNAYFAGWLSNPDETSRKKTARNYLIIFIIFLILLAISAVTLTALITMFALTGTTNNLPLYLLLFSTLIFSFYLILLYFNFTAYRPFVGSGMAAALAFSPFLLTLLVDGLNLPFASIINSLAHIAIPLAFLYYTKQKK